MKTKCPMCRWSGSVLLQTGAQSARTEAKYSLAARTCGLTCWDRTIPERATRSRDSDSTEHMLDKRRLAVILTLHACRFVCDLQQINRHFTIQSEKLPVALKTFYTVMSLNSLLF